MSSFNKKDLLDILEKRVENHLQIAIKYFQNLDSETLLRASATGGWSIAQCLDHLNSYGKYYLPLIKKSVERQTKEANKMEFKSSWLGNYFTEMMEPGQKMKKYKAFKNHIPPATLDAHRVVAEFIEQQETLLKLLKMSENIDLNKGKIGISIMKWLKLKVGDVFRFIIAHNERHIQQASRNLAVAIESMVER
jgi:hypothetical protein